MKKEMEQARINCKTQNEFETQILFICFKYGILDINQKLKLEWNETI